MTLTPSPLLRASDSFQSEMLACIEHNDRDGLELIIELALVRLPVRQVEQLLVELPAMVPSGLVPQTLQLLHRDAWQHVARAILCDAAHGLAKVGIKPGHDISLGINLDGEPILFMTRKVFEAIEEVAPHSLHLIRSFLHVQ